MDTFQSKWSKVSHDFSEDFTNQVMLLKIDSFQDEMAQLSERVEAMEKQNAPAYQTIFSFEPRPQKIKRQEQDLITESDKSQECNTIAERALEILTEWEEAQDIKLQIQYAAVIVGKLENMKKDAFIQSDLIRKKVCTLLRNVIRINVADVVFTKEQILLLKRGVSLLVSDQVQQEDMLQLNRAFLGERLMTMPAWE